MVERSQNKLKVQGSNSGLGGQRLTDEIMQIGTVAHVWPAGDPYHEGPSMLSGFAK